jgi:hypothetical protein
LSFSPELADFKSEDDFVQRLLIPLLGRIGYGVVANYHGKSEAGMDLVVGEIDRFGHVRYHGIQVKYESSIGKSQSHGLVEDAREAFATGFRHPQTGASHRIGTFYVFNAGSVSDDARSHFFASLNPTYGDNVRLLEGRDVVALDRSAAVRVEWTRDRIAGLNYECRAIGAALSRLAPHLRKIIDGDGNGVLYPFERLQTVASAAWLAAPVIVPHLDLEDVRVLYAFSKSFNLTLDEAGSSPVHTVQSIKVPARKALGILPTIEEAALKVYNGTEALANDIGTLVPI